MVVLWAVWMVDVMVVELVVTLDDEKAAYLAGWKDFAMVVLTVYG